MLELLSKETQFMMDTSCEEEQIKNENLVSFILFGRRVAIRAIPEHGESFLVSKQMLKTAGVIEKEIIGKAVNRTADVKTLTFSEWRRLRDDDGTILGFERDHDLILRKKMVLHRDTIVAIQDSEPDDFQTVMTSEETRWILKRLITRHKGYGIYVVPMNSKIMLIPDGKNGHDDLAWYVRKDGFNHAVYYHQPNGKGIGRLCNVSDILNGMTDKRDIPDSYRVQVYTNTLKDGSKKEYPYWIRLKKNA